MQNFLEIASSKVSGSGEYRVRRLQDYAHDRIVSIFDRFSSQIHGIYGDQTRSFGKLVKGEDRDTFILEIEGKEIGVLAFKNALQNDESAIHTTQGYVEVKSLFLFDRHGEGHIWKLWYEFIKMVQNMSPKPDGIYVTVSKEKAASSLGLFLRLGFKELYSVYDEYSTNGDKESHLYLDFTDSHTPSQWEIPLRDNFLKSIKNGDKTTEGRSGKGYFRYKIGDSIGFFSRSDRLRKEVGDIIRYPNVEDFLQGEGVEKCLPGVTDVGEAIDIYNRIPGYREKIQKHGIIALRF